MQSMKVTRLSDSQARAVTGGKSEGPFNTPGACESNWGAGNCEKRKNGHWYAKSNK